MLKVTLIAVGAVKEPYWRDGAAEFEKRMKPFYKFEVVEVAAEPFGGSVTAEQSMRSEGERILKRVPDGAFVVALERTGKELGSIELAELLRNEGEGGAHLVFIIGGAAGLSPEVLARATRKISMSKMTFTHEMARVFLLEQLYRAATILAGKAYHL